MSPLLLWLALIPVQADYRREDTFVFPRPVVGFMMRTDKTVSATRFDSDFVTAISNLHDAMAPSMRREIVNGGATESSLAQDFQRLLAEAARGDDMRRPPEQPVDTTSVGYWQSGYNFSLSGLLLSLRLTVYSSVTSEADYQRLRGYWKDYGVGRVFFGAGVRMRFRLRGTGPSLFTRSRYKTFSPLLNVGSAQTMGHTQEELVHEFYGSAESEKLGFAPAIVTSSYQKTLGETLRGCDRLFQDRFGVNVEMVEPIFIQMHPEDAGAYQKTMPQPRR